ncbi:MAG: primosomal protein N' [Mucilaginibacter polytrichastri]|nr:primosomal protein N' [Mucilaginibacter polytrichastri]
MDRKTLFADVLLPLPLPGTFTYRVPFDLNDRMQTGIRVVVQFGRSKLYTALILRIHEHAPERYEAKYLIDVLDEQPVVTQQQFDFWYWMAGYYLCNPGEVMQAALPSALKLASETSIMLNPEHPVDKTELSDKEFLVVDALEMQKQMSVSDVTKVLEQKAVMPILKRLLEKGFVFISEEVNERYRPLRKTYYTLHPAYLNEDKRRELFDMLERAPKQQDILLAYTRLARTGAAVLKSTLLEAAGAGDAALKALVDKDILVREEKEVSRLSSYEEEEDLGAFTFSEKQQEAFTALQQSFEEKQVVLFQGITGSGKTMVYIRLIEHYLEQGKQVLYLLPEIALTTQLVERLRRYFGKRLGVYHSRFNDQERVEVWNKVLNGGYDLVIGARSSVFLPFQQLGFVVVDEEHETSYKQFDPAPRYHARDAAIVLAAQFGAKVLLGSATPSLESYHNQQTGKYGFVRLTERFGGVNLPAVEVVNMIEALRQKNNAAQISPQLEMHIRQALERKEQVILFHNRRGYTPVIICKTCANVPKCINCDVSLTYHKSSGKLHCHYCGFREDPPAACPACGSTHLEQKGLGTEKVEDEVQQLFSPAKIARMDLDSTRGKNAFQQIMNDMDEGKTDILVGTQMVAKGLDFDRVSVIGIISADSLLKFPDYRAFERSFQLMAQVSGRAGRRERQGQVVIQTFDPQHRVIRQVIGHDDDGHFRDELDERLRFAYPPFVRLIQLDIKHKDPAKLEIAANTLALRLREAMGNRIIGPEFPLIARVRTWYIKTILIKLEKQGDTAQRYKNNLKDILTRFQQEKESRGTLVQVDVDPY